MLATDIFVPHMAAGVSALATKHNLVNISAFIRVDACECILPNSGLRESTYVRMAAGVCALDSNMVSASAARSVAFTKFSRAIAAKQTST